MNNINNIEDFFKDKFDGMKSAPNSDVWGNIESKLDEAYVFHKKFDGYSSNPGSNVWVNIKRRLFLFDFLRFSYSSFNIYYLTSALLLSGTMLFYLNNNKNSARNLASVSEISGPFSNLRTINTNGIYNAGEVLKSDQKQLVKESEEKDICLSEIVKKLNNSDEAGSETNIYALNNVEPVEIKESAIVITDPISEQAVAENPPDISDFYPEITEEIPVENVSTINENDIAEIEMTPQDEEINNDKSENQTPEQIHIESLRTAMIPLNEISYREDYIYRKDTFGTNVFDDPIIIKPEWSVKGFCDIMNTSVLFRTKDPEQPVFLNDYQNSYNQETSNNYGLLIQYTDRNIVLQSGVMHSDFRQNFNYSQKTVDVDTFSFNQTIIYSINVPDTVWFIDMDHYLATGDTQYVSLIHYHQEDSVCTNTITRYDSIYNTNEFKTVNSYRYIEMPLLLGYQFKSGKFLLTPKVGLIAGFLIKTSGLSLSERDDRIYPLSENTGDYMKTIFSYSLNFELTYKLTESLGLTIDPYFRKSLTSFFNSSSPVDGRYSATGLRLGIRYTF